MDTNNQDIQLNDDGTFANMASLSSNVKEWQE